MSIRTSPSPEPKLRVLLVDDHETVREGLKVIVNAQKDMEVVAEADDGDTAVARAAECRPDVVVMDVSMPRLNGLKATEALLMRSPESRVITLTRHTDDAYVHQLMRAGVAGYVLKQSRTAELLHAIRAVAAGGTYLDPAIARRALGTSPRAAHVTGVPDGPALTAREEEVLRLVAWGFSNKEVALQLGLSVKTVETHKANASQKLGLRQRIDIVRYALLQGWLRET